MPAPLMTAEMAEQPEVLDRLVAAAPEITETVAAQRPDRLTGVSWVARGSSDNAAVLGRYLAELATGRPSGLVAPSLITRYGARLDYVGQLVVGLSQSGETPEIIRTCEALAEAGGRVLAITNDPGSSLAAVADAALALGAGPELAVPATKTVTAQMLVVTLLAAALGRLDLDRESLAKLAGAVARVLDDAHAVETLAERWRDHLGLVVVARGLAYAAALETALKVREVAGVQAEAWSVADLLHGPIAASRPDLPVLILDGGESTADDLDELVGRLVQMEVPFHRARVETPVSETLAPIVLTVVGQQLARAWALGRGRNPDHPAGLSKVTLTH